MKKRIISAALSLALMLAANIAAFAVERVYILPSTTNEKAPRSYTFQLKGSPDKYILLDNTDEGYFVLAGQYCALKPYSQNGEPVAFDPEDKNSIAYWLNHDYLTDTSLSGRLPQAIIDNLVEREYVTEGGGSKVPFSKAYNVKCKVVLLSQTEWSKYNGKFGYADDRRSAYWALRSVRELTGSPLVAALSQPNSGLTVDGRWKSVIGIRPAFYLSKDFFEKVSVDVENTGDAVISIIRHSDDLKKIVKMYDKNETQLLIQSDIPPMADAVTIKGRGIVGEKIEGKYNFVSLDDSSEDGTMYQWQKSSDGEIWSTIVGATADEYIPTASDVGYYIRMKVSPMTGSTAGASYESVPLTCKIRPVSTPVASDVRIECDPVVRPGDILDVRYSYYDENRDICSGTKYQWEVSKDMVTAEKIGTKRNLKLTNNESGKYVRVGVTPKKKTNSSPTRKTVTGDTAYSEWIKVEDIPIASEVRALENMDVHISISKTENALSVTGLLKPLGSKSINKLTAAYVIEGTGNYETVCEWQGAAEKDGEYARISTGNAVLEYVPTDTMWVRVMVYTRKDGINGRAAYSEPVFIGEEKQPDVGGAYVLSQTLEADKEYEVWLINETGRSSYAYSFDISGAVSLEPSSDKYLITTVPGSDGMHIAGTLVSDVYSSDSSFKACEIKVSETKAAVLSNALTVSAGAEGKMQPLSAARIHIIEK